MNRPTAALIAFLFVVVLALVVVSTNYEYAGPFYPYADALDIRDRQSFGVYSAYLSNGWEVYRADDGGRAVYMRRSWLRGLGQAGNTASDAARRVQLVQVTATAEAQVTATSVAQATATAEAQATATSATQATATAGPQATATSAAARMTATVEAGVRQTAAASNATATAVAKQRNVDFVPNSLSVVCKGANECQASILVKNTGTVDAAAGVGFTFLTDQQVLLARCNGFTPGMAPTETTRAECRVVRKGDPNDGVAFSAPSTAFGDYLQAGGIVHVSMSFI